MSENIVYYSYKMSPHDHVNEHEMKRFEHSISTLRKFNNEIPVYLFCDNPDYIREHTVLLIMLTSVLLRLVVNRYTNIVWE